MNHTRINLPVPVASFLHDWTPVTVYQCLSRAPLETKA